MRACRSHSEWLDLWDVHTPFASGLQSVRDLVLRKYVPGEHVTVGEYKGDSLANSNKGDRTSKHNGVLRAAQNAIRARSVGTSSSGRRKSPR